MYSVSFGGQKSVLGCTTLALGMDVQLHSSGGLKCVRDSRGESIPCLFWLLVAAGIIWLVAAPRLIPAYIVTLPSVCFSYVDTCDDI